MENNEAMKMSMLLDDELKEKESLSLLEQIENDVRLKDKWFRYNTVSLAIKSKTSLALQPNLVERVSQAITDEPTVLARQPASQKRAKFHAVFAGALAAAVAVIAVVHVMQLPDAESETGLMRIAGQGTVASSRQASASSEQTLDSRYHDYLIKHNESAYSIGARSILPYARAVNYGADQ